MEDSRKEKSLALIFSSLFCMVVHPIVVSFDAKINFDDSAKFRQMEIFAQEDTAESDPREVEAAEYNLNYVGMDGNIGCLGKSWDILIVKMLFQ